MASTAPDGKWTADIKDLLRSPRQVVGLDFSRRAVGSARLIRLDIDFRMESADDIPLAAESFDLVSAIEGIEHLRGEEEPF